MKKKKHQIKSSWYYIFWGIMSASVVAGQIYVGTGYREMSESIRKSIILFDPPSTFPHIR
jgi:hypothetical protein|tara:strand:- start:33 stop:212 length:180 start_codon:yes stop_codon:yes gene_type:complete